MPLLTGALEVYAADVFQNTMAGNNVELRVTTEFYRLLVANTSNTQDDERKKIWGILNGSLIVPVIGTMGVLYYMWQSLEHYRDEVGKEHALLVKERALSIDEVGKERALLVKERALLVEERNAILLSLVPQNGALSRTLSDRSGSPPAGDSR